MNDKKEAQKHRLLRYEIILTLIEGNYSDDELYGVLGLLQKYNVRIK